MDRQILSQEEINALLKDSDSDTYEQLTPLQKDALGEIGNISYGSASTALSDILKKKVIIDTPTVQITSQMAMKQQHPIPYVLVEVNYKNGLIGSNILILKVEDSAIIADLMMGGNGLNPRTELGEMELSAVSEAMNQMVGSACTSLSTMLRKRIDIDPPEVQKVNLAGEKPFMKSCNLDEAIVSVSFKMQIENLIDSEIMLIMPFPLGVDLADSLIMQTSHPKPASPPPAKQVVETPVRNDNAAYELPPLRPTPAPTFASAAVDMRQQVIVQPAQFSPLGSSKIGKETPGNIGLIMDVPLQVTVELGNTRMKIKEILELGLGSIIELDKLAGDPVDIYVNGKMIAKGEVVVIDENFGIKITDIVSPVERANTLQ
jgi:flagellar motor switch protein FliN/FliY